MAVRSVPHLALVMAFLVVLSGPCLSATYYVDANHPSAGDSNPGSQILPWLTLQHAADSVLPGDTVRVMTGTYDGMTFTVSGSAASAITFVGESLASVIIDGGMEFDTGVSFMKVANFSLVDNFTWGVFIRGTNQHLHLKNLRVSGGDNGFHLTWGYQGEDPLDGPVSNIIIEDCLVEGGTFTGVDCTPGPCDEVIVRNVEVRDMGSEAYWGADGIAFERGEYITVEDCYVHDNAGDGIDIGSRDHDGYVDGVVVRRNRVVGNYSNGIKVWAGGRIENNVVWGQGNASLALGAFPGTYEVVNNTIAYNMWDQDFGVRNYAVVVAYPDDISGISAACDLTLLNNIFAFNCRDAMGGPTGLYLGEGVTLIDEGYNLYWSREDGEIQAEFVQGETWFSREDIMDGTWAAATGQGEGDVTSNPLFVSAWPNADLHLQEGSPAIDAGRAIAGLTTDVEGRPRPSGGGYDIGAYECQSSAEVPVADFSADPTSSQGSTCQVQFTDRSSGTVTSWTWDFGDGEVSFEQHPSHTYACNGPSTVSLTVSGPGGADTETKADYIECGCPCQIVVSLPAGGEIWCAGESEAITWLSDFSSGQVRIQYSTNGGGSWSTVVSSTADDGLYLWTVPDAPSTNCRVKISDASDQACSDTTPEPFRICHCGPVEIITQTIQSGTVGCPYNQTISAWGGCPSYDWSVVAGQLPDGLQLGSSSGAISGKPEKAGIFAFTIEAEDVVGADDRKEFSLQIDGYDNIKGDVNGDCSIDILDVVVLINMILEMHQPDADQIWRGDCSGPQGHCQGDGSIDILDAVKIVVLILGLDVCP